MHGDWFGVVAVEYFPQKLRVVLAVKTVLVLFKAEFLNEVVFLAGLVLHLFPNLFLIPVFLSTLHHIFKLPLVKLRLPSYADIICVKLEALP